jgi:heat shock protein HtpX
LTLYDEIEKNNLATFFLFFIYAIFYAVIVFCFLVIVGFPINTISFLVALFIVLLFSYFYVKSYAVGFVLASVGAKEVKKEEYPYLYNTIEGLSIAAEIPIPRAYIINSDELNAFATGLSPSDSYIVVTTGLLKNMNRTELEGVIAHEISHIRNLDIRTMLIAAAFSIGIAILAKFGLRMIRARSDRKGGAILLLLAVFFLAISPIIAALIRLAISRNREYAADASAAMLTRYPEGLASALEKVKNYYEKAEVKRPLEYNDAVRHLFIADPERGILSNLFSTHPPIEDRIKRLRQM